jgi:glycerate 2-kinase
MLSPEKVARLSLLRDVYCSTSARYTSIHSDCMKATPISGAARRALLQELYAAAVAAAAPGPAVRRALAELTPPQQPVWLFALGKAALPMAVAALEMLAAWRIGPAGGLVVPPAPGPPPHPALELVPGDHPEPGARSLAAAEALGRCTARVGPGHEAWVLLSGGATSLLGAPVEGVSPSDLAALYALLLGSGLDIAAMNRIRKRFSRWGGGRLAAALASAGRVRVFVISDVIGDDLASIGSGPCVPDGTSAAEVRRALETAGLWSRLAPGLRAVVSAAATGPAPETPKPGDPAFARVETRLIASNRLALAAAADRARSLGLAPHIVEQPLAGEAAEAGTRVAAEVLKYCRASGSQPERPPHCVIWGGETTVTLGPGPAGVGGRAQELALAAARELARGAPPGSTPALLAAGTDGRDGPTDAAGAVVTAETWDAIRRAGRDPERDLAAHDAYPALEAAGALLKPGLTGTNVMDVVFGIC